MAFLGRKKDDPDKGDNFIGEPQLYPGGMNPITLSFDNIRQDPHMVDTVDPFAGIYSPVDQHVMPVQNEQTNLAFFRGSFPFVPIVPFPAFSRVVALVAGVSMDVQVGNHQLVRFKGNGDYYISAQNRARIPVVGDASDQNQSLYKPEDEWYYIGGVKQISVIAPGADIVVNFMFYTTENRPKV